MKIGAEIVFLPLENYSSHISQVNTDPLSNNAAEMAAKYA